MKKKNTQTLLIGLFVLLVLMYSPQPSMASVAYFNQGTITVVAWGDSLVAGTPIIVMDSDLPSGAALETAIVYDGTTALKTQYDSAMGELVFQLPSAIAAMGSDSFGLNTSSGTDNGQADAITTGQGAYNATYSTWLPTWASATFMNGSELYGNVDSVGDVLWIETDWGILTLQLQADWRQGTFKHVIMKDTNWDVVAGSMNASDGDWRWQTSLFQDADPGWQRGSSGNDSVTITSGPVRTTITSVANADYTGLTGQKLQNVNASRTYTVYNGFAGIQQHMTIVGSNATVAMTNVSDIDPIGDPFGMKHQLMDGMSNNLGSNNFSMFYYPNRNPVARGGGAISLADVRDSYFALYNETDTRGYVYNWGDFNYLDNITKIEPGDQIVMEYRFTNFPAAGIDRFWVPFSSYTGTIQDKSAALNTMWTAGYTTLWEASPAPTTPTTTPPTTTTTAGTPGFGLLMVTLTVVGFSIVYSKKRK